MSSIGFFHQPLEFYHGRIPFIVVDLIKRLRELDAESSADILNEDNVGNNIDQIINELNMRPIKNWKNYKNVSTLSIALVRYLNSITFDEPLFTNACKDALVEANLTLKSPNYAHVFRKNLVNLYPGNYRTILAVTDFLRNVETTSLDAMFEQFGPSFFGKNAIQRNRSQFRVLFIHLLIHHSEIFKGAILGQAAYLTPQQIAVLERRLIEKSSSNNSSADKDTSLVTPRNVVAPQTPKSPPSSHNSSKPQKKSAKPSKNSAREKKIKEQFLDSKSYYEDNQSDYDSQIDQTNSSTYPYQYYTNYDEEDMNSYTDDNDLRKNNPKKSHNSSKNNKNGSSKKNSKSSVNNKQKHSKSQQEQETDQFPNDVIERDIQFGYQRKNRNHQAKIFSPSYSNEVIADIKPSTFYTEASAQAACLTMTAVKSIFSNDIQSNKKQKRKIIKVTRRKPKSSESNNHESENEEYNNHENEKEEYSDNDNENDISVSFDITPQNDNNGNDYTNSGNYLNQNDSSSLVTSETYHRNAISQIKKDEKIHYQENSNQNSSQVDYEIDSGDIFQTD